MKLSTLLKNTIATKIVITDTENGYKRYIVNYLDDLLEVRRFTDIEFHFCKSTLDSELTKRKVKYFTVYNNELHITL